MNEKKNAELVNEIIEEVKMLFYLEFDEIIPSVMAEKLDELKKKYTDKEA